MEGTGEEQLSGDPRMAELDSVEVDPDLDAALDDRSEISSSSAVAKFRRNTIAGAVLNGFALGLAEVFDPVQREEAPIVQDADDEPDPDRFISTMIDPDNPAASVVSIKPWLAPEPLPKAT